MGSGLPHDQVSPHLYPHTEHRCSAPLQRHPHLEPGAISCPLWELLWREEEPSASGKQEYWQLCIYGRLSEEMKKFGEADKKLWGQITIQSETRNAWLICLFTLKSLQSASFQVDSCNFQWERNFLKMLQCGAKKKIFPLICTEKSLTLLFLPPTFPFQQERWKKKQEKEVKWDDSFFKLKKTFSHSKYLNINKYKLANNQTTNFILMKHN